MEKEKVIELAKHVSALSKAIYGMTQVFQSTFPDLFDTPTSDSDSAKKPLKKEKKKKDPNAPKHPLTSYILFCREKRPALQLSHPDSKFTELGKQLGEMWKSLSAEEKKVYEDMAMIEKEEYVKKVDAYQGGDSLSGKRKGEGKESDAKKRAVAAVVPNIASSDAESLSEGEISDDEEEEEEEVEKVVAPPVQLKKTKHVVKAVESKDTVSKTSDKSSVKEKHAKKAVDQPKEKVKKQDAVKETPKQKVKETEKPKSEKKKNKE